MDARLSQDAESDTMRAMDSPLNQDDPTLKLNKDAASVNVPIEQVQPMDSELYEAAALGRQASFERLRSRLELRVTPQKNTALHLAVRSRQKELVMKIIDQCPSLLLRKNLKGDTPLHIAARAGLFEIVKLLVDRAITDHGDLESGGAGAGAAAAKKELLRLLKMTNMDKDTALHEAVRNHHPEVAKLLVEADSELPYSVNNAGESILYLASVEGLHEIVLQIIGICPYASHAGPGGRTALHAAVIHDRSDIMTILLEKRPDLIKEAGDKGWIPLHYAALIGSHNIVKQLLDSNKTIAYLQDKDGITALHIAASKGHSSVVREITAYCPDCCELLDKRGRNALHFAVESGKDFSFMSILSDNKFSFLINEPDNDGNTPFHLAAITRQFGIAAALVGDNRVDKRAMNKKNQTVLDILNWIDSDILDVFSWREFNPYIKFYIITRLRFAGAIPSRRQAIIKEEVKAQDNNGGEGEGGNDAKYSYTRQETMKQVKVQDSDARKGEAAFEAENNSYKNKLGEIHLLVATLIATVTFAAGFTLPGGYDNNSGPDEGMAVLTRKTAFKAFMISDTIAMSFSTSAVFIHFWATLSRDKKTIYHFSRIAAVLTSYAIFPMSIAFGTGTYVVLPHSPGLATATCAIGSSFFFLLLLILYGPRFCW